MSVLTVLHVGICVILIGIVLLQQGKGADAGATFGGGGNTMFGASGADNLLTKVTTIIAICFMATSVFLAYNARPGSITDGSTITDFGNTTTPATNPSEEATPAEVSIPAAEDVAASAQEVAEDVAEEVVATTEEVATTVSETTTDVVEEVDPTKQGN
jgi:preprotein translocase subunit SecG